MPDLIYNVKFNIDSSETEKISAPIDGSSMAEVEQLKQEIEELRGRNDELVNSLTTLEETMNRVGNSSGKAAGRVGNVGNQSRKTGKRIGDLNKQTAAFNQTIFAFGDLAQDTIQFQYGIATGMRAIGNNIGFAAELFANAALNVRRYNEAVETGAMGTAEKTTVLKAFGQSLFGVGGLILAVNAATTAVTFFTAKMEESKSEVNEAKDVLKSYAGEVARLKNIIGEDPLGVTGISLEMRALQDAVQGNAFGIQRSLEGIREAAFSFGEVIDSYNQKYEGTSFFGSLFDLPSGLIELSVGSIMASLDALTGSSAKTARVIGILSTGISQASVVGGAFANSILNATVQIDGFVSTTGETSLTVGRVNELLKDMNDELDRQNLLLSVSPLLRYQKDVTTAADTLVLFNKAGYDNEQQIRSQVESLKAERDALVGITVQLDESSEAYKTNVALISILIKAIANLEGQLDDTTKSTKDFSDELFDVSARIRRAVFEASQFEAISMFGDASGEAAELIFNQSEALVALTKEIKDAQEESPKLAERLQRLMDVVGVKQQQDLLSFGASLSGVFDAPQSEVEELTAQYEENVSALVMLINTQEKGSPVRAALIQQLLDLQSGYEGAKQAIEDKTRAEYADLIASEQALNQYGKAYQQAVMFVREHEAALVGLSPQLQALEGQYASLAAQNLVQSLIGQFDTGEDPMDKLNRQLADTRASLDLLKDKGLIDQDQLNAALLALEGVGLQQKELIANQEVLNNLQAAMSMAQAIGQLGEVFEASKQFQYAVALTSGALGIVLALSDSTQKSTLARFALAASVAAATAVQIKQIADTNIGSTGNVQTPDVGSFGAGSSMTQVQAPTQNISFAPTAQNDGTVLNINNQVLATNKGLALITRAGEREIANSQKTVA